LPLPLGEVTERNEVGEGIHVKPSQLRASVSHFPSGDRKGRPYSETHRYTCRGGSCTRPPCRQSSSAPCCPLERSRPFPTNRFCGAGTPQSLPLWGRWPAGPDEGKDSHFPQCTSLRAANSRPYRVNSSAYLFVGAIINRLCAGSYLPHCADLRRPEVWPPYRCTIGIPRRAGRPLPAVQATESRTVSHWGDRS